MTTDAEYRVRVTSKFIRAGLAGDCLRCAVALALDAATGDQECMVVERDWTLYVKVWCRWIVAPPEVRQFVHAIDAFDRDEGHRPQFPRKLSGTDVAPFEFALPPPSDPAWEEQCDWCAQLFDHDELDDDGVCEECREKE